MKAKAFLFGLIACWLSFQMYAQQDTLFFDDYHEAVDFSMQNFSSADYHSKLLERALSDFQVTNEQASGNYNQIHDAFSWLGLHSDVHYAYLDSTQTKTNEQLVDTLFRFFERQEIENEEDILIQPFGILLHRLYRFDSTAVEKELVHAQNGIIVPDTTPSSLFYPVLIKSAALLELYGENGYPTGIIQYNEEFISVGDDINLTSIRIDVGNGFEDFNAVNSQIEYSREKDSTLAFVALEYIIDEMTIYDTLTFFLTKASGNNQNFQKFGSNWDKKFNFDYDNTGVKFRIAVKFGCGNTTKEARRPFIIVPPYRPSTQLMSLETYYEQFNIYGMIDMITELGYDVYFIKIRPGNVSLEESGIELTRFLYYINEQKNNNYNAHFPGESWENCVMGFSAGGQIARFALTLAEKWHMELGMPHPHTRLYAAFDSPHWGANVPMFTQVSIYEMKRTFNIFALMVFNSITDEASKDMLVNHIYEGNLQNFSTNSWSVEGHPSSERTSFINSLYSYAHFYTHTGDLRASFPTFSRNIAIATGRNDVNYDAEFGLSPAKMLFRQIIPIMPTYYGFASKFRTLYAAGYNALSPCFFRTDIRFFLGFIPIPTARNYYTKFVPEWDMAQGGYKDEFYDKDFGVLPISPVGILKSTTLGLGIKHYDNHVSFLPVVSALGINPNTWQNNNLAYNLKDKGLMYQKHNSTVKSNFFGYPNLAFPATHFNITPFEAVFADPHTYEHIKYVASADPNHPEWIDSLRNFILNEVEGYSVYMQNKVIGQNHILNNTYRYKAWYKAQNSIVVGKNVTPKTDIGDYVIQPSGDIVMHAGVEVLIEPGFSVEEGATFEAAIEYDGCVIHWLNTSNHIETKGVENQLNAELEANDTQLQLFENSANSEIKLYPNPNSGNFTLETPSKIGNITILDMYGKEVATQSIQASKTILDLQIPHGIYFLKYQNENSLQTLQFVVL